MVVAQNPASSYAGVNTGKTPGFVFGVSSGSESSAFFGNKTKVDQKEVAATLFVSEGMRRRIRYLDWSDERDKRAEAHIAGQKAKLEEALEELKKVDALEAMLDTAFFDPEDTERLLQEMEELFRGITGFDAEKLRERMLAFMENPQEADAESLRETFGDIKQLLTDAGMRAWDDLQRRKAQDDLERNLEEAQMQQNLAEGDKMDAAVQAAIEEIFAQTSTELAGAQANLANEMVLDCCADFSCPKCRQVG